MTNKERIDRLEKTVKPNKSRWNPPKIEVEKGHEQDPEHLKKLAEILEQAKAAGYTGADGGAYVVVFVMDYEEPTLKKRIAKVRVA